MLKLYDANFKQQKLDNRQRFKRRVIEHAPTTYLGCRALNMSVIKVNNNQLHSFSVAFNYKNRKLTNLTKNTIFNMLPCVANSFSLRLMATWHSDKRANGHFYIRGTKLANEFTNLRTIRLRSIFNTPRYYDDMSIIKTPVLFANCFKITSITIYQNSAYYYKYFKSTSLIQTLN